MIFTSATAFEVDGVRTNHESKEDKIFYPRGKGNWNPSLPKVFAVTLVITILSLYFIPSYSYISKIVFAKVNTSESKLTQPQNSARDVTFELQPFESSTGVDINTALLPTTNASKSSNEVPKKPNVTLDKAVNFSIPRGSVAITFDDGPSIHTKDIVNILEKYHVGGTFFFVGTQVKKYPESVKYVDDYDFSIGNHSMSHANLSNLSIEKQRFELEGNNRLIESIISKPVLLFRPPYGSRDVSLSELTAKNNMKMVLWNNDPEDWHKQSQKTLDYIFQTRSTGAIILLHESKETLQILPTIIEYLQNQQLNIVNLN
ncbi:polysaccharide deacetylase family protein [Paenibacillus sp. CMAA1364]